MLIVIIILAALFSLALVALDAWLLSIAVPALLNDPTNWWGWVGVAIAALILLGGVRSYASNK